MVSHDDIKVPGFTELVTIIGDLQKFICVLKESFKAIVKKSSQKRVRKKGSFGKGVFRKVQFLGILENSENPQTVENKGESDHFLEFFENLDNVEILETLPVKRPPFSGPDKASRQPQNCFEVYSSRTMENNLCTNKTSLHG